MFIFSLKEDIHTCLGCGKKFKGTSIGPHYKNHEECLNIKNSLENIQIRQNNVLN